MSSTAPGRPSSPPSDPAPGKAWWGDRGVRTKILAAVRLPIAVGEEPGEAPSL